MDVFFGASLDRRLHSLGSNTQPQATRNCDNSIRVSVFVPCQHHVSLLGANSTHCEDEANSVQSVLRFQNERRQDVQMAGSRNAMDFTYDVSFDAGGHFSDDKRAMASCRVPLSPQLPFAVFSLLYPSRSPFPTLAMFLLLFSSCFCLLSFSWLLHSFTLSLSLSFSLLLSLLFSFTLSLFGLLLWPRCSRSRVPCPSCGCRVNSPFSGFLEYDLWLWAWFLSLRSLRKVKRGISKREGNIRVDERFALCDCRRADCFSFLWRRSKERVSDDQSVLTHTSSPAKHGGVRCFYLSHDGAASVSGRMLVTNSSYMMSVLTARRTLLCHMCL